MSFWKKLKNMLPASKRQIRCLEEKIYELEKENKKYIEKKFKFTDLQIEHKFQDTNSRIIDIRNRFIQSELRELLEKQNDTLSKFNVALEEANQQLKFLKNEMTTSINLQEETLGYARENNWGIVFNNTIEDCDWLKEHAFSLGRWAIGYQCAYVLFRVLDEVRPDKILELGLGQSTKFLGQYASNSKGIKHMVVESDPSWIEFFKNNYELSDNSNIVHCDWDFCDYKGAKEVRIFDGFSEKIAGQKFNLIMIDAPFGGDMKEYARIDVLQHLPECIEDSFVIMIDDVERQGEQNTFNEMKMKLEEAGILFVAGLYKGKKSVGVIVSENLKFVLTM
ncbi:MAG: hypothetical protein K2J90_01915 [Lachnospiraceae bacterium]|nr:hypothetical protein [Lachnospiraceae bacterium]